MKKVFKTISRLLLCGVVAFSLSACDNDKNNDPKPADDKDKTEVTPTEPESPENPDSPETPETPTVVFEMVDLGLSVKWANMNLGANAPEEYGDYYAWGETSTKEDYSEETSLWYGKSKDELMSQGVIDENGNLTAKYDAATANLGGKYRMPTVKELIELKNDCTWEWTAVNDVYGYKVTGPNGNSIFLPAAVHRYGSSSGNVGSYGYYWSSTAYDDSYYAYYLYFNSSYYDWHYYYRYNGLSVRPVMDK